MTIENSAPPRSGGGPVSTPSFPAPGPREAYVTVAGLMVVLMGVDAFNSVVVCGRGWGLPGLPGPLTGWTPRGMVLAAVAGWLIALSRPAYRRLRVALLAGAAVLGGAEAVLPRFDGGVAAGIGVLAVTAAAVWLCLTVAAQQGITRAEFGFTPAQHGWAGHRQAAGVFIAALAVRCLAGWVARLLQAVPWPPSLTADPASTRHIPGGFDLYAITATAGVREVLVLLAVPVIFLAAARRPVWQIYTIAMAAELVCHLYLGAPAAALMIFTAVGVWLFRRTGRSIPLIAAQTIYDLGLLGGHGAELTVTVVGAVTAWALPVAVYWHQLVGVVRSADIAADRTVPDGGGRAGES